MSRLTKGYIGSKLSGYSPEWDIGSCIDKLGELEDIEEELGIDLIKFFNNYRELKSLKGRGLKISIEELQKELENDKDSQ